MRNKTASRLLSALLALTLVLSSASALAATIRVDAIGQAKVYSSPTDGATSNSYMGAGLYEGVVDLGGEYYLFELDGTNFYIKKSEVTLVADGTASSGTPAAGQTVVTGTTTTSSALLSGAVDPTYSKQILNYTVPAAGLFLYASVNAPSPATSVASGNAMKLTYYEGTGAATWYSTWYDNTVYYVKKSDLAVDTTAITVGKSFSLTMTDTVPLYSEITSTNDKDTHPTEFYGKDIHKAGTLNAGATVYVTVNKTKTVTLADEVGNNYTKTYATWYSFNTTDGVVRYFKNPGIDKVLKEAVNAYTALTVTSRVPYYATVAVAQTKLGTTDANIISNAQVMNLPSVNGRMQFRVYKTKHADVLAGTNLSKYLATPEWHDVVYDLRADTGSDSRVYDSTTKKVSYNYYTCYYVDSNGNYATGYLFTRDLGGTASYNIYDGTDMYKSGVAATALQGGGLLYDSTNTSNWPQYRSPMFGQYTDANLGYSRFTSNIAIDQSGVAGIAAAGSVADWYKVSYRDGNNNLSKDNKTTYPNAFFKTTSTITIAALQSSLSIFNSVSNSTDLEKFPTGWYGSASGWQGLYSKDSLTNRSIYKTQTKVENGETYYRVTWYRVQYVDYNGNVQTGYYENPEVYGGSPYGYKLLTANNSEIGGTAYDTTNATGTDTKLLKVIYGKSKQTVAPSVGSTNTGVTSASVNASTYLLKTTSTMTFKFNGMAWDYDPAFYGVTPIGVPQTNDTITITVGGSSSGSLRLYTSKSKTGYYYQITFDGEAERLANALYGLKADDEWYEVVYNNGTYYVLASEITTPDVAVAVSDKTLTSSSFYATIGSSGAQLYTYPNNAARYLAYKDNGDGTVSYYKLPSGDTILTSQYSSGWYKFINDDAAYGPIGTVYYIASSSIAAAAASGTETSYKVLLNATDRYTEPEGTTKTGLAAGWYAVQKFNAKWYSIRWTDGKKYYVPATAVASVEGMLPITSTGKTYNAVVGASGAYLFYKKADAEKWGQNGATPASSEYSQTLSAGTKITVKQVYSFLYLMTTDYGNRYVSLRDLSAIIGGDDDTYVDTDQPKSGVTTGDVTAGKTDANYTDTVLSYTTPTGGLWLYSSMSKTAASYCAAAGTNLSLSSAYNADSKVNKDWYATWLNNTQYYVLASDLKSSGMVSNGGTYTIQTATPVNLYSQLTSATNRADDWFNTGYYGKTEFVTGTLPAGTYNVKAYQTKTFTAYDGNGNYNTVTYPTWYSYVTVSGNTVYFQNPNLASFAFDYRYNTSDTITKFAFTKGTPANQGQDGTRLYYSASRDSSKANGTYSAGTSSQYTVYAGIRASEWYSNYASFQYDNNYDTTTTGWQSGRTSNNAEHRSDITSAWNRVVPYEKVTDIEPYMYSVATEADGSKTYSITWYQGRLYYNYNTKTGVYDNGYRTVYFKAADAASFSTSTINGGELLNASITSGTNVSFTLSVPVASDGLATKLLPNMFLYASPSESDDADETIIVKTRPSGNDIVYLPGISFNSSWYKVIYNNEGWYVKKSDVVALGNALTPSQNFAMGNLKRYASNGTMSVATYAVTIGSSGARLYTTPSTNASVIYSNTYSENNSGSRAVLYNAYEQNAVLLGVDANGAKTFKTLSAGANVSASVYNSEWYTYGEYGANGTLTTYYFRAAAVANANDTGSVDSYILTIPEGIDNAQMVTLYASMSTAVTNPGEVMAKLPAGNYTARKMNATWSRVTYNGLVYYFKTAQAEALYSFTATAAIPVYSDSDCTISAGSIGVGYYCVAAKYSSTVSSTYLSGAERFFKNDAAGISATVYTFTTDGTTSPMKIYTKEGTVYKVTGKTLPAGTYTAQQVNSAYAKITLSDVAGLTGTYYIEIAAIPTTCTFTTKAVLDVYNKARVLLYGADEYNGTTAAGLPVGSYSGTQVDSDWIQISTSDPKYNGKYVKAADITTYTQYTPPATGYVINSSKVMANSQVYFYNMSSVSTGSTTQTSRLSSKLGSLTSKATTTAIDTAAQVINGGTGKTIPAANLAWPGVYNKAVKLNEYWGSVVIPEIDPLNGRNYTYTTKSGDSSVLTGITLGTTKYAQGTYYFYHYGMGGTWGASGTLNGSSTYSVSGVNSAVGAPIATVKDGGNYVITIGANGATVYNNAKLEADASTTTLQVIPAGTQLSGTKLTAAYEDSTQPNGYGYRSIYRITYNGYTAYISAADVVGVKEGEDAAERANSSIGVTDSNNDTESLDLAVGDPALTVRLATTITVYSAESLTSASTTIAAGESISVIRANDAWYKLTTTSGLTYYIPVSDLTMEDISSNDAISDGTGYITKLLSINIASGSTLNLRKTPSSGGAILAYLQPGTYVTNLGYTVDANNQLWYHVSYNGVSGYVLSNYVAPVLGGSASNNSAASLAANVGLALSVNTEAVNVRAGAGPEHASVAKLASGTIVVPTAVVTGSDGLAWYKIIYNGVEVYIRYDYVTGGSSGSSGLSGNAAIRLNSTNMRSGAGKAFSIVTRLNKNTVVTILSTSTDSDGTLWYRVTQSKFTGYVRSDLLRSLTTDESAGLVNSVVTSYSVLKVGSRGSEVTSLQQALIKKGYNVGATGADGIYGANTMSAVQSFQQANNMTANGTADATTQAKLYGTYVGSDASTVKGNVYSLDWFGNGYDLINAFPNVTIYDCNTGVTWNAKYINGKNHADVIPASATDAALLTAYSITGSYVRRPVIVTINGTKYAGSMYAVGHGTTSYCDWFSGVMCIHFTGSKTHSSAKVDSDHQSAIQYVLKNYN